MPGNEYKLPEEIGTEEHFAQTPTEGYAAMQQASESFKEINEKLDAILAALGKEGANQ